MRKRTQINKTDNHLPQRLWMQNADDTKPPFKSLWQRPPYPCSPTRTSIRSRFFAPRKQLRDEIKRRVEPHDAADYLPVFL
jgi:hypothetical protein